MVLMKGRAETYHDSLSEGFKIYLVKPNVLMPLYFRVDRGSLFGMILKIT